MDRQTIEQLRGAKDLLTDGVEGGATAVADAQRDMTHRVYDLVACLPGLGGAARGIEAIQQTITADIYSSIRAINRLLGVAADCALNGLAARISDG